MSVKLPIEIRKTNRVRKPVKQTVKASVKPILGRKLEDVYEN